MNLTMAMLRRSLVGIALLGLLLFLPAGTLDYWQGWFFLVLFAVMTSVLGLYLARHDPALLERRMKAGAAAETRPAQKRIIRIMLFLSLTMPMLCALDRRFGWSFVPPVLTIAGGMMVVAGLLIDLRVFRENSFGASTIRIMAEQRVI